MTAIETEHHKIESIVGLQDYLGMIDDKIKLLNDFLLLNSSDCTAGVSGATWVAFEMGKSLEEVVHGLQDFDLIPKTEGSK